MSDDVFINELMATGVPWQTATLLGELESDIQLIPSGGDDSALIQNAMYAAAATGRSVSLSTGTFLLLNGLVWPVGFTGLIGAGPNSTVLRRMGSVSNMITAVGCSGFLVASLCLDGNKTFNAVPSNGVLFNGCSDFQASGVRIINQKTGTNYGDGIQLINTPTTNTTGRGIVFDQCQLCDNDQSGLHVVATGAGISIKGGVYSNNGLDGIFMDSGATPVVNTMPGFSCIGVRAECNGSGIVVTGFRVIGAGGIYTPGHGNDPACGVSIVGNQVNYNTNYGIFCQATGGALTGNTCRYNGTTNQAGICTNAQALTVSGNTCEYNAHHGIDSGGAWDMTICDNVLRYNNNAKSTGSTSNGIGCDLGANQHTVFRGNLVVDNGINGVTPSQNDAGQFYWPWDATDITIDNNVFVNTVSGSLGGVVGGGAPTNLYITNNKFYWTDTVGLNCIVPFMASGIISGNTIAGAPTFSGFAQLSLTPLTPPDWADVIQVTNNASIIGGITTKQQNIYAGHVTAYTMTNRGNTTYTSAPTVTVSGDGTGATATAQLTADGFVAAVVPLTPGSGYTTATVGFSGGGGSGAAATTSIGMTIPNGRQFTLVGTTTPIQVTSSSTFVLNAPTGVTVIIPRFLAITLVQQTAGFGMVSANSQNVDLANTYFLRFYDASGNPVTLRVDGSNNFILTGTNGSGGARTLLTVPQESNSGGFQFFAACSIGHEDANFVKIDGAATTLPVTIFVDPNSSDTNVPLQLTGKGTSGIQAQGWALSGKPTTTNVPSGYASVVSNSNDSTIKLYFNLGGTLYATPTLTTGNA